MEVKTPIKAIRAKCLDCCCDSFQEVKLCPITDCPLYPYRLGHRPKKEDLNAVADNSSDESISPENKEKPTSE